MVDGLVEVFLGFLVVSEFEEGLASHVVDVVHVQALAVRRFLQGDVEAVDGLQGAVVRLGSLQL